jgi:hypothetical protein
MKMAREKTLTEENGHEKSNPGTGKFIALVIAAFMSLAVSGSVMADPIITGRATGRVQRPVAPAMALAQETLAVTYYEGRLSVRAKQMPLVRVLQEVSHRTGLEVRVLSTLQEEVSVVFAGVPLLDGLRRLLAPVNYLLLFDGSSQGGSIQPTQALVFGGATTSSSALPFGDVLAPSTKGVALNELRQATADADPSVRRWVVERFGEQGDSEAFPYLLNAVEDGNPWVRQAALESLSQFGEMAIEPLRAALQREQHYAVRIVALGLLGNVGREDEQSVVLLNNMLRDDDPRIRAATVHALGNVVGSLSTDALNTAARDADPEVRIAALRTLALSSRDASAQAVVEEHLDDTDEAVREVAADLLERFTL